MTLYGSYRKYDERTLICRDVTRVSTMFPMEYRPVKDAAKYCLILRPNKLNRNTKTS